MIPRKRDAPLERRSRLATAFGLCKSASGPLSSSLVSLAVWLDTTRSPHFVLLVLDRDRTVRPDLVTLDRRLPHRTHHASFAHDRDGDGLMNSPR